jgi:hypothetical protein
MHVRILPNQESLGAAAAKIGVQIRTAVRTNGSVGLSEEHPESFCRFLKQKSATSRSTRAEADYSSQNRAGKLLERRKAGSVKAAFECDISPTHLAPRQHARRTVLLDPESASTFSNRG